MTYVKNIGIMPANTLSKCSFFIIRIRLNLDKHLRIKISEKSLTQRLLCTNFKHLFYERNTVHFSFLSRGLENVASIRCCLPKSSTCQTAIHHV